MEGWTTGTLWRRKSWSYVTFSATVVEGLDMREGHGEMAVSWWNLWPREKSKCCSYQKFGQMPRDEKLYLLCPNRGPGNLWLKSAQVARPSCISLTASEPPPCPPPSLLRSIPEGDSESSLFAITFAVVSQVSPKDNITRAADRLSLANT